MHIYFVWLELPINTHQTLNIKHLTKKMQLQMKNCSSFLVVDSIREKIAEKVIVMHGNGGCTVAKVNWK